MSPKTITLGGTSAMTTTCPATTNGSGTTAGNNGGEICAKASATMMAGCTGTIGLRKNTVSPKTTGPTRSASEEATTPAIA